MTDALSLDAASEPRARTTMTVRDCRIEIIDRGSGRPIVFLHPGIGLHGTAPLLEGLAGHGRIIAPAHPGFERSALPRHFSTVDDLAYFYLDLLDEMNLNDVVLIGASFGGWIAAEMAVKSCERLFALVLADAVGIKIGSRESRDITDIYALPDDEVARRSFSDPAHFVHDYQHVSDPDLLTIARNREAHTLFGWAPYMHNPKLLSRLHRIKIPTLVLWGSADGIVTPDYGRAYAAAIPGARFQEIAGAGHYPHIEQPEPFARQVLDFIGGSQTRRPLAVEI